MLAGSREGGAAVASASRAPCEAPRRMPVSGWGLWPLQTGSSSSASSSRPSTPSPPSPYDASAAAALASPPSTPPDSSLFRAAKLAGTAHAIGVTPPSQPMQQQGSAGGRSRNDIFSAASPSLTPAPRPAAAAAANSSPASVTSKNSLFFGSSPVAPAPRASLLSPTASPSPAPAPGASRSPPRRVSELGAAGPSSLASAERPSYGRSSTEERERERDRIRKSKDMDFRLCPTRDYLLGEGRHCNVFLGSYRLKRRRRERRGAARGAASESDVSEVQTEEELAEESYWQLCAVKRLHADRQSQLLGLDEAFALRRLGPHPNIVSLIDIRDEVELPTPVSLPGASGNTWASMPHDAPQPAASPLALGKGLPSRNGSISTIGGSAHARSSSTAHSRADLGLREPTAAPASHASDAAHAIALHRRLASQPSGPSQLLPEVRVAGPDEDGVGPLAHRSPSPAQSIADPTTPSPTPGTPSDPPRLLILLELLPHSLRSFARRNPERIGWLRWKTWALQLAGTVEWMHARGCVHVDIKPENILLTDSLDMKLCDFNSALFPSPSSPLLDGAGLGTPAYGAPELTRGAAPAGAAGFSYPVDVWSMGAVLYSLATGVEPFARSRSMIDMLYRKRVFFESEENDRVARLSVAEGWAGGSNGGSASASRNGSLRGRRIKPASEATRPTVRREGSTDSIESVASSILVDNGRTGASVRSIAMLLDDAPFKGLLSSPAGQPTGLLDAERNGTAASGHQRRASMGKTPQKLGRAAYLNAPRRPVGTLRRTTSYGDQSSSDASPQADDNGGNDGDAGRTDGAGAGSGVTRSADSKLAPSALSPPHSPPSAAQGMYNTPSGLRLAVTAAFAQASRRAAVQQQEQQSAGLPSSAALLDEMQAEEEEDLRPYRDGSPALILPGGGRLPDAARALLERMLSTDPSLRPTAKQVVAALSAL